MRNVLYDHSWTLLFPDQTEPQLNSRNMFDTMLAQSNEFERGNTYRAQHIWEFIIKKAMEPHGPSIMFADHVNGE